jgi:hypothetical protein
MRLAFASAPKSGSANKLFTRRLDQLKVTELPGTEGGYAPFFSPDRQWIGFKSASGRLMAAAYTVKADSFVPGKSAAGV